MKRNKKQMTNNEENLGLVSVYWIKSGNWAYQVSLRIRVKACLEGTKNSSIQ